MPDLESESEGSKEATSKADIAESSESRQNAGEFSLFGEPGTGLPHHQWMPIKAPSNETAAVTSQADTQEAVGLSTDADDMSDLPELGVDWPLLLGSGQSDESDDDTSVHVPSSGTQLAVMNHK